MPKQEVPDYREFRKHQRDEFNEAIFSAGPDMLISVVERDGETVAILHKEPLAEVQS